MEWTCPLPFAEKSPAHHLNPVHHRFSIYSTRPKQTLGANRNLPKMLLGDDERQQTPIH